MPLNILLLSVILLLSITACARQARADPTPPTIHYGEDICEFCGMIISEERYAAGYITRNGEERIFDDIGDMVQDYLQNQDTAHIRALFVHDHDNHTWIRAETAYYLLSSDLPTPMLSGLAAFPSAEKAEEWAAELGGKALTFDELLTHYRENPPNHWHTRYHHHRKPR